jgi:hypothetical protein
MNERQHNSGRMAEFDKAVAAWDREALLRSNGGLAPVNVAHADAVDELLEGRYEQALPIAHRAAQSGGSPDEPPRMSRVKWAPRWRLRKLLVQVPIPIIAIAASLAWVFELLSGLISFLVAVAGMFAWTAVSWWIVRRYRCPNCRSTLSVRGMWSAAPKEPIYLHCQRCDIDWDFGFRGPEPD